MSTRRTFLQRVGVGAVATAGLTTTAAASGTAGADLFAPLTSGETVPKARSRATGSAVFTENGDDLDFEVTLKNIEDVTQAHIHAGARGETGNVVAFLVNVADINTSQPGDGESGTPQDPLVVTGTISDDDLLDPNPDPNVDDTPTVADLLTNPTAYYVNVHTVANRSGEVRGQLRAK